MNLKSLKPSLVEISCGCPPKGVFLYCHLVSAGMTYKRALRRGAGLVHTRERISTYFSANWKPPAEDGPVLVLHPVLGLSGTDNF